LVSVASEGSELWPLDEWKTVTRQPLAACGEPEVIWSNGKLATKPGLHPTRGKKMSTCQIEAINAGGAYPRSCPTCGLAGKCVNGLEHPFKKAPAVAQETPAGQEAQPVAQKISDKAQELAAEFRGNVARQDYERWGEDVLPLLDWLTFRNIAGAPKEVLRAERDEARAGRDFACQMLSSIYGLLNPPDTAAGGKTYRFNNPIANETLHQLSERIRSIPDELRAAGLAAPPQAPAAVQGEKVLDLKLMADRLRHAVEGECDGLDITHKQAKAILDYVLDAAMPQATQQAEAAPAQPSAAHDDFDKWSENPYTKVLQKSIAEDYVPRASSQPSAIAGEADQRVAFLEWLQSVHLLDATWNVERNCFDEFPAHLAYSAWRAALAQRTGGAES
jgi:hypothetical protein